jgi:hypothetical protein
MTPEEKNVADRVHELADAFHTTAENLGQIVMGLAELGVPSIDVIEVSLHKYPMPESELSSFLRGSIEKFAGYIDTFVDHVRAGTTTDLLEAAYADHPMAAVIDRLLKEAPRLNGDPTQAPAAELHVLLHGKHEPLYGALSKAPGRGMYRMLQVANVQHDPSKPPQVKMLESFFHVSDVQSVMVEREVKAAPAPSIIIS